MLHRKLKNPNKNHRSATSTRPTVVYRGLPLNLSPAHWPTNQAPASYAFIAAKNSGSGDLGTLVHAMTRACWAEDCNIAEDDVIRDCLAAAGFDPDLAGGGLLQGAEE